MWHDINHGWLVAVAAHIFWNIDNIGQHTVPAFPDCINAACFNKIEKHSKYGAVDANVFEVWMRRAAEQLEVPSDAGFLAHDIFPRVEEMDVPS